MCTVKTRPSNHEAKIEMEAPPGVSFDEVAPSGRTAAEWTEVVRDGDIMEDSERYKTLIY